MTSVFSMFSKMRRLREAALWRIRISEKPVVQFSPEFQAWREQGEAREAHATVSTAWRAFDGHENSPQMLALRRRALDRARVSAGASSNRRIALGLCAAALIAIAGAVAVENFAALNRPVVYATGVGERRVVVLADGSRLMLDASSAVTVQSPSMRSRALILTQGRARFDVAHDKTRPFTVMAGHEITTAVGTSFDVERLNSKIFVTLRTGRVVVQTVSGAGASHSQLVLNPGEELIAHGGQAQIRKVSLGASSAWETGQVVLTDQLLGDAVQQFNRYLEKPISVDPAVANMRVSGVFRLEDAKSFIAALTSYLPVNSHTGEDGGIYLERRV